jgi:hypothetical protein
MQPAELIIGNAGIDHHDTARTIADGMHRIEQAPVSKPQPEGCTTTTRSNPSRRCTARYCSSVAKGGGESGRGCQWIWIRRSVKVYVGVAGARRRRQFGALAGIVFRFDGRRI